MKVGIYARVASTARDDRSAIERQLAAVGAATAAEADEVVARFVDDGYSGMGLERPGLDALRDAARVGTIEAVWCWSPDRLARSYYQQVVVLDELAGHGVAVRFACCATLDGPRAHQRAQLLAALAAPISIESEPVPARSGAGHAQPEGRLL